MIHFTCDICGRAIQTEEETRYVLRLEVFAAPDDDRDLIGSTADDPERDYLAELDTMIELGDSTAEPLDADADDCSEARYDLCSECRKRMLSNPLKRLAGVKLGFSQN